MSECVCAKSLSRVRLFATPWTVAHQAPLSMGFSRQEYWSGLPGPPPGDLPDPGIEPVSPVAPALQADSLPLSRRGSPHTDLTLVRMAVTKNAGKAVKKREPSYTAGGNVSWFNRYGKPYGGKTRNRVTARSSNPTPGHISRQNYKSKRHTHPYAQSSTVYSSQDMATT